MKSSFPANRVRETETEANIVFKMEVEVL